MKGLLLAMMLASVPAHDRVAKVTHELRVNQEETTSVTSLSEAQGRQQIRTLVQNELLEEGWSYVPNEHVWIETIGRSGFEHRNREGIVHTSLSSQVDTTLIGRLLRKYGTLHQYHFHPVTARLENESVELVRLERTLKGTVSQRVVHETVLAALARDMLPSTDDLSFVVLADRNFSALTRPGTQLRHFVSSRFGTIEYALTEQGRAHFADVDRTHIFLENAHYTESLHRRVYVSLRSDVTSTRTIAMQDHLDAMSKRVMDEYANITLDECVQRMHEIVSRNPTQYFKYSFERY